MAFIKPNVNTLWAEGGEVVAPAAAKVNQGWIAEIPDYQFENWIQQRQDAFNAHVNQYGIPVWDSVTEYLAGKSYVQGSDGEIYKALTTNTNSNPTTPGSNDWQRAFDTFDSSYSKLEADSRFLIKSNNLSDLTNNATARTNLNVYAKSETFSKAEADGRFLLETNNLSDLTNKATARTNLDVYSKAETSSIFLSKSDNLASVASKPAARTNLDVYSKGESDSRYQVPSEFVGMVAPFAVSAAPTGWLKCDGSAVSRSTYLALFNRIGTLYGSGDGSTTFNLPDLRGEFIRGWDDGKGVDLGRAFGSNQADELRSHSHAASTGYSGSHNHTGTTDVAGNHRHTDNGAAVGDADGSPNGQSWGGSHYTGYAGNHSHTFSTSVEGFHIHTVTVNPTGGNETRPRNVAMLYCIKY